MASFSSLFRILSEQSIFTNVVRAVVETPFISDTVQRFAPKLQMTSSVSDQSKDNFSASANVEEVEELPPIVNSFTANEDAISGGAFSRNGLINVIATTRNIGETDRANYKLEEIVFAESRDTPSTGFGIVSDGHKRANVFNPNNADKQEVLVGEIDRDANGNLPNNVILNLAEFGDNNDNGDSVINITVFSGNKRVELAVQVPADQIFDGFFEYELDANALGLEGGIDSFELTSVNTGELKKASFLLNSIETSTPQPTPEPEPEPEPEPIVEYNDVHTSIWGYQQKHPAFNAFENDDKSLNPSVAAVLLNGKTYNFKDGQDILIIDAGHTRVAVSRDGDVVSTAAEFQADNDLDMTFIVADDSGVNKELRVTTSQSSYKDFGDGIELIGSQNVENVLSGTNAGDKITLGPRDDFYNTEDTDPSTPRATEGDIVRAGAGDDAIVTGGGDDVVYGQAGNDKIVATNKQLEQIEDDSIFVASAEPGNVLTTITDIFSIAGKGIIDRVVNIFENVKDQFRKDGNNKFFGGEGNDFLIGGNGNDDLDGGKDKDILKGGRGNDTLTGGEGADTFVFSTKYFGNDTVTDFEAGMDLVALNGFTAANVTTTTVGKNTILDFDNGSSVTFVDTRQNDLAEAMRYDYDALNM